MYVCVCVCAQDMHGCVCICVRYTCMGYFECVCVWCVDGVCVYICVVCMGMCMVRVCVCVHMCCVCVFICVSGMYTVYT